MREFALERTLFCRELCAKEDFDPAIVWIHRSFAADISYVRNCFPRVMILSEVKEILQVNYYRIPHYHEPSSPTVSLYRCRRASSQEAANAISNVCDPTRTIRKVPKANQPLSNAPTNKSLKDNDTFCLTFDFAVTTEDTEILLMMSAATGIVTTPRRPTIGSCLRSPPSLEACLIALHCSWPTNQKKDDTVALQRRY